MAEKSGSERRVAKRKSISLSVKMRVPLPEGGSATLVAKAKIVNLSLSGAGVFVHSLQKEHVPLLLKSRRRCLLVCELPSRKEPAVLQGDITWTDVKLDTAPASAYLGVHLNETKPEELQMLSQFLEGVEEKP